MTPVLLPCTAAFAGGLLAVLVAQEAAAAWRMRRRRARNAETLARVRATPAPAWCSHGDHCPTHQIEGEPDMKGTCQ